MIELNIITKDKEVLHNISNSTDIEWDDISDSAVIRFGYMRDDTQLSGIELVLCRKSCRAVVEKLLELMDSSS